MTAFVALLRAVNVGGTGKLPMADLRAMCEAVGFRKIRTYIASGNVVFTSDRSLAEVKAALEVPLADYAGKPVEVVMRTAEDMAAVLAANPFPDARPNRTVAIFLNDTPPADLLDRAVGRNGEDIRVGRREIYVHYGEGMGTSRLAFPAIKGGTARNMNTVAKLVQMAGAL